MYNKKENLGPVSSSKRPKIGETPMVGPSVSSRGRQPLSNLNAGHAQPPAADTNGAASGSDANATELNSREDVERVLNEKMKGKNKNDYKGKSEQMSEYIKKLRTCIRWLIEREDASVMEQEKLQRLLESEEKRHLDNEAQMRNNIEELVAKIEELQRQYESIQELFRKEESDKILANKSYEEEKEVRIVVEKSRDALSEELVKAGHETKCLDDKIKVLEASNKRLQEYNTSLQQYNCNLQAEVVKNGEIISKLNEEKNSMMGTLTGFRNSTTSLKTQLDSYRSLQNEAAKQKEDLRQEVNSLKTVLQQVREDRDHQLEQIQSLVAEIANYKELSGKSAMEVEKTMTKANVLEETCSSQRERIQALLHELAVAKEKLKAFSDAWSAACAHGGAARFLIPEGTFLVGPIMFLGPCLNRASPSIEIKGKVLAPSSPNSILTIGWIEFRSLNKFVVGRGGVVDDRGADTWKQKDISHGIASNLH